jgi:tRNA(fMet)-specific endonuclease VapC
VGFLRGEEGAVSAVRAALEATGSVGLSAVSAFELLHPAYHRKLEKQRMVVKSFIRRLRLLPLDGDASEESARIMGQLLRLGQPVNALDVLIAGTALANGAEGLLSADRDYERIAKVSDLHVELVGGQRPR